MQRGQAVLPAAEKVARAALREVRARDLEPVAGPAQDLKPLARGLPLVRAEKHAVGLPRTAADAAAQLVQLGQAEPVRVLDHHQVGVRHVHADLDHGRRNQDIVLPGGKIVHHLLLVRVFHAAVQHGDAAVGQGGLQVFGVLLCAFEVGFALLDERTHHIDLSSRLDLFVDERGDALSHAFAHRIGLDRAAAGRHLV